MLQKKTRDYVITDVITSVVNNIILQLVITCLVVTWLYGLSLVTAAPPISHNIATKITHYTPFNMKTEQQYMHTVAYASTRHQ